MGDYPGNKSALRKPGWETFPIGNTPIQVQGTHNFNYSNV